MTDVHGSMAGQIARVLADSPLARMMAQHHSPDDTIRIPPCTTHGERYCTCAHVPECEPDVTKSVTQITLVSAPYVGQLPLGAFERIQERLQAALDAEIMAALVCGR